MRDHLAGNLLWGALRSYLRAWRCHRCWTFLLFRPRRARDTQPASRELRYFTSMGIYCIRAVQVLRWYCLLWPLWRRRWWNLICLRIYRREWRMLGEWIGCWAERMPERWVRGLMVR